MIHPAYLAGIIDGEGSLMLPRTGPKKRHGLWCSHCPKVSISNTNVPLLEAIRSQHGGRFEQATKGSERCKDGFRLSWFGKDALSIVAIIYPFMLVKRAQADALIRFIKLRESFPAPRTHEQLQTLADIAAQVKELNRRGK